MDEASKKQRAMKKEHYTHLVEVFSDSISYIKTIENWHSYYVAERILKNQSLDYESPIRGLPEDYADDIKEIAIERREEAYRLLFEKKDYLKAKDRQKPQPLQDVAEPLHELKDLLPKKLRSDEAMSIFQKAIQEGLIERVNNNLHWIDTKQLLAYFADKMSSKFSLSNKKDHDDRTTTNWKVFETIFKEQNLKTAKQNWMRLYTRFEPTGYEKVDAIM